jgi:ABC-type multidrug transport system fused ATPase/permease subunit
MAVSLLFLIVLAVPFLAAFVWWLLMLVDALKFSDASWSAAGESKVLYVLLMVFLGLIGTLLYVLIARPKLRSGNSLA